jgi:hypothetical protein
MDHRQSVERLAIIMTFSGLAQTLRPILTRRERQG